MKELNVHAHRHFSGTQWATNANRTEYETRAALAEIVGREIVSRFATLRIVDGVRHVEIDVLVRARTDDPEEKRYRRRPGER